jgi:hypothetical protein
MRINLLPSSRFSQAGTPHIFGAAASAAAPSAAASPDIKKARRQLVADKYSSGGEIAAETKIPREIDLPPAVSGKN